MTADRRSGWCDACMGSTQCWVCGGEGAVERRSGTADCPSCATTGVCRYCAPPAQGERTIVLEAPADRSADAPQP